MRLERAGHLDLARIELHPHEGKWMWATTFAVELGGNGSGGCVGADGVNAWRRIILRAFRVEVAYTAQADLLTKRPCIVVSNHQSLLDGVLFALSSPVPMDFAVTPKFALDNPATRRGLALMQWLGMGRVIPVSKSSAFGMRAMRRALLDGRSVMIFPTGTIGPAGEQHGYEWLARQTGCPVIRASISGADRSRLFSLSGTEVRPKIVLTI